MSSPPSRVQVRDAVPADYDDIARITVSSYVAAGHMDSPDHPYLRQIAQVARRHEATPVWVAEREGRVVGSVTLARHGNPYADIARGNELEFRMLVVDPGLQRSGAGRALVEAVIGHARALEGVDTVCLTTGTTWEAAQSLYRALGFQRAPERDWYVPGTDILLFVFELPLEEDPRGGDAGPGAGTN
ncbi:GNAT family N-acetyltransferase [Zafaria sp. Z1313]|uniref:GNAT family N-acetyltransferase n=1 Tax=unclassified Zafaria TaxID=2828765 RepID=UPI002E783E92|nr:GNAT family N-acetyltransferase [Zafaria sp. J156]MEE1620009.1 GNAT family N-acetyltransferase [Zafaria sp. J156]